MSSYIISGTDTDIGKTVAAAMLTLGLNKKYWKPIQSGTADGTDTKTLKEITNLPDDRFVPETYILSNPLSPHRAAELDEIEIDLSRLDSPPEDELIIEGAGGLLVPITRTFLQIDLFQQWDLPIILCARTGLGTINHSLLSIQALKQRKMKLHGLIFIGEDNHDNIRTIHDLSDVQVLGHLPVLDDLNDQTLSAIFKDNFNKHDF